MSFINVFWFRRDLRLNDNHGLFKALQEDLPLLPLFIFDTDILSKLDEESDKRVSFIVLQLKKINEELKKTGSSIEIRRGKPFDIFNQLTTDFQIKNVFTNHDYEPYAIRRDNEIKQFLNSKRIGFLTFKDQVIFEKNDVFKNDGHPYTVFTPYAKKWQELLGSSQMTNYPSEKFTDKFIKKPFIEISAYKCPEPQNHQFPNAEPNIELIKNYAENRNFPSLNATSMLGVHLRFGSVSSRQMVIQAQKQSEVWLNELIWREFFMQILYHFPQVENHSFKPSYDAIEWLNNEKEFSRWCQGTTGFAMVDAGMRQLNTSGFMHNRVRMIAASFLTKHLLIDWRWGEAYFASKLLDFELSSNNGNWQWAAGSGCDAAPYFRIFNPVTQQIKFDAEMKYIRKWVPEYGTSKYPKPIVEHELARERCIKAYKKALTQ